MHQHQRIYVSVICFVGGYIVHCDLVVTTDVQSVSICLVGGTTYSIQCSYVMGSNARGCVYFIMGTAVGNVTGAIVRSNSEGVTVELPTLDGYNEVLAYDWESDNSTGTLPIKVMGSKLCPITAIITTGTPMNFMVSKELII